MSEYQPPAYEARSIVNQHGKRILRLQFDNPADLERYFIEELIGSDMMKGCASKAIGSNLLIWDR